MKNSSEAIQISKSISSRKLNKIFKDLCTAIEFEFWLTIEEGYNETSTWSRTPQEDLDDDEDEFIGIIEIDVRETPFNKIASLVHEIGHYLLEQDEIFVEDKMNFIYVESLAWYLGYKFLSERGYQIDREDYNEYCSECLNKYIEGMK